MKQDNKQTPNTESPGNTSPNINIDKASGGKVSSKNKKKIILICILATAVILILAFLPRTDHIEVIYNGSTEAGVKIDDNADITVTSFDQYGKKKNVSGWYIENPTELKIDQTAEVTVVYKKKKATLAINCTSSAVTKITASYDGDTSADVVLNNNNNGIKVTAEFENGTKKLVTGWTIKESKTLKPDEEMTVTISYEGAEATLTVPCSDSNADYISAQYTGSTDEGTVIDSGCDGMAVSAYFSDGTTKAVDDWTVEEPVTLEAGKTSTINIFYRDLSCTVDIVCTSSMSAFDAYDLATSLTFDDLTKTSSGNYEYNGFEFTPEDSEWIDSDNNETHDPERYDFYNKMANVVEAAGPLASYRIADTYIKCLMGYIPEDYNEFVVASGNARNFIVHDEQFAAFRRALTFIDSATVEGGTEGCTITISDLTQCAKDLHISEEMLGYIIAAMEDNGAGTSFFANSCVIVNSGYPDSGISERELGKEDYIVWDYETNTSHNLLDEFNTDVGSIWIEDSYENDNSDENDAANYMSYRGIMIGDSAEKVQVAYGGEIENYTVDTDGFDDYAEYLNDPSVIASADHLADQAKYKLFTSQNEEDNYFMCFYFNADRKLIFMLWNHDVQ